MKKSFAALSLTLLGIACKVAPAFGTEQIPIFVKELLKQGKRQEAIQALVHQRAPRGHAANVKVEKERTLIARQFVTNEGFQSYQDGVNLLDAERFEEARERFREALAKDPDNLEILIRLGQVEVLLERSAAAQEYLGRTLALTSNEPETYIWMGRAALLDKKWAEAIQHLTEVSRILPQSEAAPLSLSRAFRSSRQLERANAVLVEDMNRNPYHLNVLVEWAEAIVKKEKGENLWKARKELQLGLSRLEEYSKRSRKFEGDLSLPPRDKEQLKEKIEKLLEEADLKLASKTNTAS